MTTQAGAPLGLLAHVAQVRQSSRGSLPHVHSNPKLAQGLDVTGGENGHIADGVVAAGDDKGIPRRLAPWPRMHER